MSTEEWRPIPGFPGYEASDQGRVRSLDRISTGQLRNRVCGRLLAQQIKPGTGYLSVHLTINGRGFTRNVHVLIAATFLGPRPERMDVCHGNGERHDNRPENLRYDTRGANLRDSVAHGTHPWANRSHCRHGHEFTPENTRVCAGKSGEYRRCRECLRVQRAGRILTRVQKAASP